MSEHQHHNPEGPTGGIHTHLEAGPLSELVAATAAGLKS